MATKFKILVMDAVNVKDRKSPIKSTSVVVEAENLADAVEAAVKQVRSGKDQIKKGGK